MGAIVNAGIETEISLIPPTASGVELTVSGDAVTVALSILPADRYLVKAWLSDDEDGQLTSVPPDVSMITQWEMVTDDDGEATFTVEHSGARSWYFCWVCGENGKVNVSSELEFT
jgi:hypothetical protein